MGGVVKLRFRKGQARVLRNIRDRLRRSPDPRHNKLAGVFATAAAAAQAGEPCGVDQFKAGPFSIEQIADGFTSFGAARPEIVE